MTNKVINRTPVTESEFALIVSQLSDDDATFAEAWENGEQLIEATALWLRLIGTPGVASVTREVTPIGDGLVDWDLIITEDDGNTLSTPIMVIGDGEDQVPVVSLVDLAMAGFTCSRLR